MNIFKVVKCNPTSFFARVIICFVFWTVIGMGFADAQVILDPLVGQLGTSNEGNLNINHPDGVLFQDTKRAVIQKTGFDPGGAANLYSGVLINSATNAPKPMFLTAAHNLKNLPPYATQVMAYFTANHEMPHAITRGSSNNDYYITQTFPFTANILVRDAQSDIALLEITNVQVKALDNVYVSGWQLQKPESNILGSAGHSLGDHKKLYYSPNNAKASFTILSTEDRGAVVYTGPGLFFECFASWNGVSAGTESGCSGAPLFNDGGSIVAILSGTSNKPGSGVSEYFSSIQNAWLSRDPSKKGLGDFLDPANSLINRVPGGYYNDLLPVENDFSLILSSGQHVEPADVLGIDNLSYKYLKKIQNYLISRLGLRINNGNMELGVQNSNNIQKISGAIPVNQWVFVTGIFNNGKLSLYVDGTLAAEKINVGFTSVPVHPGAAGLGATNGTNAFDQANNHFNGWVDELKIYNVALLESEIEFLSGSGTVGTVPVNAPATVQEENKNAGNLITDNKAKTPTGLIIYPNPSKGDVNVITEVKQAGPVSIQIIDMQGRVVYEKNITGVGVGFQQVSLRNINLKAASYIVKVESRGYVQTGKLVVEN
ncbi:MAG: LamG-like jellyroll fold domain-containing protein [Bacteroidota bacterium]